jgi:hypothetical protein
MKNVEVLNHLCICFYERKHIKKMVSHSVPAFDLQINVRSIILDARFCAQFYKLQIINNINMKNHGFPLFLYFDKPHFSTCFP